jgi:Sec-independent protein translocase protein TatA
MRRPSTGNVNKRGDRNSWYDEFRKKMKEEQIQARKEQKEADKEKKKEKKKLERQERRRKENEAREALRKQGMFSGGYLARYA